MEPSELGVRVDRALRSLPSPRAPQTLLPRVLLAARALALRPWYTRAWVTWPGAWQAASTVAIASLLVALGLFLPDYSGTVTSATSGTVAAAMAPLAERTAGFRMGLDAIEVLWRALVQPVAGYLLAAFTVMWLACATFGVALTRIAFGLKEATES